MHTTHHCKVRQSQRGITPSMVDYVLSHGTCYAQDKIILGKKEALNRLAELEAEKRLLMKITDKGGVVVIQEGDSLITTYNCSGRH
jgi:hypothetical protein